MPIVAALPGGGRSDRIVVDVGPGSFTGVRIGIAAARALGFAWGIPVTGYSALSIIAAAAIADHAAIDDFPVVNTGGHGKMFWQMFSARTHEPVTELASTPIAALASELSHELIYGTGAQTLVATRGWGASVPMEPDSRNFSRLSAGDYAMPASPIYGRSADAKPMADRSST